MPDVPTPAVPDVGLPGAPTPVPRRLRSTGPTQRSAINSRQTPARTNHFALIAFMRVSTCTMCALDRSPTLAAAFVQRRCAEYGYGPVTRQSGFRVANISSLKCFYPEERSARAEWEFAA